MHKNLSYEHMLYYRKSLILLSYVFRTNFVKSLILLETFIRKIFVRKALFRTFFISAYNHYTIHTKDLIHTKKNKKIKTKSYPLNYSIRKGYI